MNRTEKALKLIPAYWVYKGSKALFDYGKKLWNARKGDEVARQLVAMDAARDPWGWGDWKITDWEVIRGLPKDILEDLSTSSKFSEEDLKKIKDLATGKAKRTSISEEDKEKEEKNKKDLNKKKKSWGERTLDGIKGFAEDITGISTAKELYKYLTRSKQAKIGNELVQRLEDLGVVYDPGIS